MSDSKPNRLAPALLFVGFIAFLIVIAYVVASSLVRPDALWFEPSAIDPRPPQGQLGAGRITVDARDSDTWVFVDLDRASVVPVPDTSGWDLAIRRFDVVPSGAALDLGAVAFDSVLAAPETGYQATDFARDTVNPVIARWYRYSFTSHILQPNGHVYVVRTADGRYAKLTFLSYYCPEVTAGCVTFRYVYQPSGARDFSRSAP